MAHGVVFYVCAHQDDWELFGGEQLSLDLEALTARPGGDYSTDGDKIKAVIIYTTAGDAGLTNGWWEARERGALLAARSAYKGRSLRLTQHVTHTSAHPILRYDFTDWDGDVRISSYHMRLPDGRWEPDGGGGEGYPPRFQSLARLKSGAIDSIQAVDGSTIYATDHDITGWDDFRNTCDPFWIGKQTRLRAAFILGLTPLTGAKPIIRAITRITGTQRWL